MLIIRSFLKNNQNNKILYCIYLLMRGGERKMKKSKLFKKLGNSQVVCQACHRYCQIAAGQRGACSVRENKDGQLYSLVYGWAVGPSIDPVEKKPLFHFLPGTKALSFGTLGCNFSCQFCQNWSQSQGVKQEKEPLHLIEQQSRKLSPKQLVNLALKKNCASIAYTYNEPAVFVDYAYETMRLARQKGLKNIFVTNGYQSPESFELTKDYLDAVNVDLKSFGDDFYQKICGGAKLAPVLENIKKYHQAGIWTEVTTLVISGENDSAKELTQMAKFIKKVSPDIPWHLSAFHPDYQMMDKGPTSWGKLVEAYEIGQGVGLNYVYLGNIVSPKHASTYCPKCGQELVKRDGYYLLESNLKDGECLGCGQDISGVW
ncbi:MAG: AmmeMemoRadiSam system radical SAM enzyme [Patescibacteria group bacterium]|jgi:pyruvate formate lyase activating enzyme